MEKKCFGAVLGSNRGVDGYCNTGKKYGNGGYNYVKGLRTGYKYQCVEYARRWLILVKDLTFQDVMCACDIWGLTTVEGIENQEKHRLVRIPNGSQFAPQVGALLIYKRRFGLPFGHVAIITDVDLQNGFVKIAEQNEDDNWWPGDYSRQIRLEISQGQHWIRDKYTLFGWMVYEDIPDVQPEKSSCSVF